MHGNTHAFNRKHMFARLDRRERRSGRVAEVDRTSGEELQRELVFCSRFRTVSIRPEGLTGVERNLSRLDPAVAQLVRAHDAFHKAQEPRIYTTSAAGMQVDDNAPVASPLTLRASGSSSTFAAS